MRFKNRSEGLETPGVENGFFNEKERMNTAAISQRRSSKELCESLGGRPGHPVPNSPYGLRGPKATLNLDVQSSGGGRFRLPVPNKSYGFCGHQATLNLDVQISGAVRKSRWLSWAPRT